MRAGVLLYRMHIPNSIRLVIFDLDGTLADSTEVFYPVLAAYLRELGFDYDTDRAVKDFFAISNKDVYERLNIQKTGKSETEFVSDIGVRYRAAMAGRVHAAPGARELIGRLRNRDIACRVASNGERDNIIASLLHGKLGDVFADHEIFSAQQTANPKPAPDLYRLAMQGFAADQTLAIEDSITGVKSAVAAGLQVWGYTGFAHDPRQTAQLRAAGADPVFADFLEID